MKNKTMAPRMTIKTAEQVREARMTPEQYARFDAMTDDDIDYSDIPDQSGKKYMRPGSMANLMQHSEIAVRVDAGVAEFFQAKNGTGIDHARVSRALSEYVEAQRKAS